MWKTISVCSLLIASGLVWAAKSAPASPWVQEAGPVFTWQAVEDDAGGFYLVWTRTESSGVRLLAQHFAGDGSPQWNNPGQSMASEIEGAHIWSAFPDSKHGLILAWIKSRKVFVQQWSPDGQALWTVPTQVSDSSFTALAPVGVADGAGGAYVIWPERSHPDRSALMAQHLDSRGVAQWQPTPRISTRPSDQRQPAVVYDGAAGFIVSWADYRDPASDWRIQRMNYQGFRLWGLEGIQITAPASTGSSAIKMAPWGQGSVTLAWADSEAGKKRVKERQLDPKGQSRESALKAPPAKGEQWNPVLTGNGAGRYWLGWEDNSDDRHWQIHLKGAVPERALAPSNADQGRLVLQEDGFEGVFAAWIEVRGKSPGLYAQHLDKEGKPVWKPAGREIAVSLRRPGNPKLVPLGPDRAAIFWSDQPKKGSWAVYFALL